MRKSAVPATPPLSNPVHFCQEVKPQPTLHQPHAHLDIHPLGQLHCLLPELEGSNMIAVRQQVTLTRIAAWIPAKSTYIIVR